VEPFEASSHFGEPGSWGPRWGAQKRSNKRLNAATNLEGGKGSQKKVSLERVVFDFVLQLSNRFLVSFDSSAWNNARFSF
jgi:hypothetical protein